MSIIQEKRFYLLIKVEQQNKLSLHVAALQFPLGKTFRNQKNKNNWRSRRNDAKSDEVVEKIILFNSQKEIFYKLVAERSQEKEKLHISYNLENLIYHFKSFTKDIDFNNFIDAETQFSLYKI